MSFPPGRLTSTSSRELSPETSDRDRGRGARAAGERLADAALEHSQRDAPFVDALHEADVHTLRKARMSLEHGPSIPTGARSTESTGITMCGLPIDTAPNSTLRSAVARDSDRGALAP